MEGIVPFESLFSEPSRNGLTKPKAVRGAGTKIVNMGELFAYPRMTNTPADKAPLSPKEKNLYLLKSGDLLFARQSLVPEGAGKCSIFIGDNENVTFESHLIRIRLAPNKACPMFYYYYFRSPIGRAVIESIVEQGAGVAGIRASDLSRLDVDYIPIKEQEHIADILGSLDDKIELNRKMNETLEAMARAIFKSWFVDFDPVVAKSEGRQPEGMDAETAKLFPSSFEDSEIGRIPKGWQVKPLTQLIEVNPYRQLAKGKTAPYLDMAALPTNSARPQTATARAFSSGSKFKNGDTLLARITPCLENGKTGFVDSLEDGQVGWGSTEFIVLCPKASLPPCYAYFLARTEDFRAFAIANMTGTSGRQRIVVDSFSHFLLPEPPAVVAQVFGDFAVSVLMQMKANDVEIESLSAIRNTLLPRLLSGDFAVSTN